MPLKLNQKQTIVAEVNDMVKNAVSIVAAEYRGLTSAKMALLRTKARKSGVTLKVVRNTLARRAFEGTSHECLVTKLTGPMMLAFANDEPGAAAKVLRDFAKENEILQVAAISLGKDLIGKEKLDLVANLPNRDEALSRLLGVMQAPIVKLARTLAEPHAKLVRTFAAIRDQKQA